uniref:Methyltransferase n=1 Tax=viral metagenome TaxID=1070528 RepID=A0A6C0I0A5_9ZZZZ
MNIKIVYFAYLIPEKWEDIVIEQLDALSNIVSLYEIATIYMSVIDDTEGQLELEKLKLLISEKYNKIQLINTFSENVYEYPGIKTVYEISTQSDNEYILYFHSKGITSNQHDVRNLLFQYTIQNYQSIIEEMEKDLEIDTASAIPCVNGFGYYNFWWARSSYIHKYCSKPEITDLYLKYGRFTWEMWLGNHFCNKQFVKTYSPILKYNYVYEEIGAGFVMQLFIDNQVDIINKLENPIEFNNIITPYNKPMNDIADNNLTDKNTAHSYFDTYEKLFSSIRITARNILEVGIFWGGSIRLWRDYFSNAQIYGVDICNLDFIQKESIKNDNHITLFTNTNGYDDTFINENFINKNITFDMILDDGPHDLQSMIDLIVKYVPLLTENGIMVIEDVQDFQWTETLKEYVPNELKQYIQVYDLRHIKGRYDDILFVINKNI